MNRLRYFFFIVLITISGTARANISRPDTTSPDFYLSILETLFRDVEYASCDITIREGFYGSTPKYVSTGKCKIRKNNFYIHYGQWVNGGVVDSSYYEIQNQLFCVSINKIDSTVIVQKPRSALAALMQVDLSDTLFRSGFVRQINVSGDSTKVISVIFSPESPYESCFFSFKETNFFPNGIQLTWYKTIPGWGPDYVQSTITFTNVSFSPFPDSVFATDSYFLKRNGKFELTSPYQQYQLFDHTWLP